MTLQSARLKQKGKMNGNGKLSGSLSVLVLVVYRHFIPFFKVR